MRTIKAGESREGSDVGRGRGLGLVLRPGLRGCCAFYTWLPTREDTTWDHVPRCRQ